MLGQRRRRWANIGQTLARCIVYAGKLLKRPAAAMSVRVRHRFESVQVGGVNNRYTRQMDMTSTVIILYCAVMPLLAHIDPMLGQNPRRWPNINPALGEWLILVGPADTTSFDVILQWGIKSTSDDHRASNQWRNTAWSWMSGGPAWRALSRCCAKVGPARLVCWVAITENDHFPSLPGRRD